MSHDCHLADMSKGKSYLISGFAEDSSEYAGKLHKMGFIIGTTVALAPVNLLDPMIVQIRGSRVALRKHEARQILVEEV